jgi:hypothetical protein
LKSGLLGASASGAVLAAPVVGFGLTCEGVVLVLGGFAAAGTVRSGAIWASAGPAVSPAKTLVTSKARQPLDIELNSFISNENPSIIQPLQRLRIARQSLRRHSRAKSVRQSATSQTNP